MKRALGLILISTATAHAEPAIEYGAGAPARALQSIQSAGCDLAIDLHGAVATVETRERLANTGSIALAVRDDLALPTGAVLIGAAIASRATSSASASNSGSPASASNSSSPGSSSSSGSSGSSSSSGSPGSPAVAAVAVPAAFSTTTVTDADALGPDPLLVQAIPDGYRATLQPIEPGREITLITRYAITAELAGGALHLTLPGHPDGPACHGIVRAIPGPGARITAIRVANLDAPRGTFTLGAAPLSIDVALDIPGTTPIAWTQTERLDAEWSATLVTVLAPEHRARTGAARALFVIDGSRSMDLVGSPRVVQVMRAIAAALPPTTELDAIIYDRTAARILGEFRPATPGTLDALAAGITHHAAGNGTDLAAAFALAHTALAGARGPSLVIALTDGVLGDTDGAALTQALDTTTTAVDVHAILLDPGHTRSPGTDALRAPIHHYGGTLVELDTADLDHALASVDDWLRPAALELALTGSPGSRSTGPGPGSSSSSSSSSAPGFAIPGELRAGRGFTRTYLHREPASGLVLTGHDETAFRVPARPAPAAPIAALALAAATPETLTGPDNPSTAAHLSAQRTLDHARAAHPYADPGHAFAALATTGKVAASRRQMVAGGGPYERTVALADPPAPSAPPLAVPGPAPSAIDKLTLERLFRDQLSPRAYACYQRALGTSPRLAGTATFDLHIGRGEVSQAQVSGLGDATFEACLLDAAYALQPPLPDFAVNADDQTIVHYPLSFTVRDDHPLIMAGDADSSSPLDIDAIQGGVPARRRPIHVDASTPLGNLPRH